MLKSHYDAGVEIADSNILPLHRNENAFVDQAWLQEMGCEIASTLPFHQYPDSQALQLRKALADAHAVDFNQVYVGHGADGVLSDLFQYFRSAYDEVGTLPITYRVYPYLLQRYGYRQVSLADRVPELCVVDSPNSITGEIFDLSQISPKVLIWDNVYGEFANDAPSITQFPKNQIIIRSFSKFYGLANLRIGYCFASPELVSELLKRKDVFHIPGFSQEMAIRLLKEREKFLRMAQEIRSARAYLKTRLNELGFILSHSEANFIWITHPFFSMKKLYEYLYKHLVAVRHFNESTLAEHLRITVPKLEFIEELLKLFFTFKENEIKS